MKISEVSKKLLQGVGPIFERKGFKLNTRGKSFFKRIGDVNQIVEFFMYKRGDSIEIEPRVRVKIESVENIYKSISKFEDRPYCTIGNHLSDILRYMDDGFEKGVRDIPQSDWLVTNQSDINKLIEVIPEYFEETILPYFGETNSLAKVDELLNKYPRELSVHNYLYPLRANIAIIAAKLNSNPKLKELINIYEEELQDAEASYKEEFDQLKERLLG